ncbi:MAG: ABC transporter permease subunit [Candidatus Symbiothrix sp.]|nr:ABC transporter permease subunit [Candidatus Symbiothrix sp.]
MSFIRHIRYVSKFESKLLLRGWFFRIFAILVILILVTLNIQMLLSDNNFWAVIALPSNIPYFNLLLLNTGQAVVAIFLASDFLKRDKKLDTSEVFYVRPLSNAEYVFGKILGNLRVFLILNLIAMAISIIFTLASPDTSVDWSSYLVYFFVISIPTLVYIIGLSIFLMLVLRNQALTFILLLGYIGVTLFYVSDKFYYLFDYMAYYLPLMKSTIVGFPNWDTIITHRAIYFFAGLTCIFITIPLFGRLPNSSRGSYPWIALSICTLIICVGAGYKHVSGILWQSEIRLAYTQINNQYVHTPKMLIDKYDISVTQHPQIFTSSTKMTGLALATSSVFTFCLNPGLEITEIKSEDKVLIYNREKQIILIDFGREIAKGDTVSLSVNYGGRLDNSFCYLDIPKEELEKHYSMFLFNSDKQYSFQTDNYALLTPETYWYPRPGTSYSDKSPDWQQTYFSRFTLNVIPLSGLIPLSQGEGTENEDGSYSFAPEYPAQAISLIIGNYKHKSTLKDSVLYSIKYIDGHDFFSAPLDSISDTIPALARNLKEDIERTYKLDYPFKRFSIIEVPAQFYSYPHAWSQAQEVLQPEMVFFTEKGWDNNQLCIKNYIENYKRWMQIGHEEASIRLVNNILSIFARTEGNFNFSSSGRGTYNITSQANPYFIFPQLFNFRYNIYSPDWAVANRVVELYLQNNLAGNEWEREVNGISSSEKASLLLEKNTFKDLLSDVEQRNLMNSIAGLKAAQLFAPAELKMGVGVFRDFLYRILKDNTFRNVKLESILDTMGKISETDILSNLATWNNPVPLPVYDIGEPEVIHVNDRGVDFFVLNVVISNNSDYDGIVQINLGDTRGQQDDDLRTNRKVLIPAHKSKQLTSIWDNEPDDLTVNTMISGNLPSIIRLSTKTSIKNETRKLTEQERDYILPENISDNVRSDEVIVDNEDTTLFILSKEANIGLLPKWMDNTKTQFKYSGFGWWRPPIRWTATTNAGYYGKYIRSAYVVKSVSTRGGTQTATWNIPVPVPAYYELYYHVFKDNSVRYNWNRNNNAEYKFKVAYGKDVEDAYIRMTNSTNDGWEQLGVYYFESDTVSVTLSNECKLNSVTADAVKIVRRR